MALVTQLVIVVLWLQVRINWSEQFYNQFGSHEHQHSTFFKIVLMVESKYLKKKSFYINSCSFSFSLNTFLDGIFHLDGIFQASFSFTFFVFCNLQVVEKCSKQLTGFWNADIWLWKWLLCQLSHHYCIIISWKHLYFNKCLDWHDKIIIWSNYKTMNWKAPYWLIVPLCCE